MKNLFLLFLLLLLCSCATTGTETPMSITAKTLLTSRQAVIGAAKATDALCKIGDVKPPECAAAKKAYEDYQTCYTAGSVAFLMYVQNGAGDYNALGTEVLDCQQKFGGIK